MSFYFFKSSCKYGIMAFEAFLEDKTFLRFLSKNPLEKLGFFLAANFWGKEEAERPETDYIGL